MTRRRSVVAAKAPPTILEAMDHPDIWRRWFNSTSWSAWRVFQAVMDGLPLSEPELEIFRRHTGRRVPREGGYNEAVVVVGRRGGKSLQLATRACHQGVFRDWRPYLKPGEKGHVVVIGSDRRQCRTIMNYVRALLLETPALKARVIADNAEDIELVGNVVIEVATCSYKTIRGRTVIAALCDEAAFWSDPDGKNPDHEVLTALRPAMATVPGALLLIASSPYARKGIVWDGHRQHYGKEDSPVLAWQGSTPDMNPTPGLRKVVAEAYERDPVSAAAEYGAQFRLDLEAFLSRELVDNAVDAGVIVRPPIDGVRYFGGCDPAGGAAGGDSFTAAIAHAEGDVAVLDCLYERKGPFNPAEVCREIKALLASYGVSEVMGDHYSAQWVVSAMAEVGITYRHSPRDRSALYSDVLPLFSSGRVRLIDNQRMVNQWISLERRTSAAGKDRIDHPVGGHEDLANSAAIGLCLAVARPLAQVVIVGPIIVDSSTPMTHAEWLATSASPFARSTYIDFANRSY